MSTAKGNELGGVLEFMRLLWALNHELDSLSKRMSASFGVTGPQRLVIRLIGQRPQITAGELARLLQVHPSTMTGVLHRLVAHGLVARKKDPGDARRAMFALTARGKSIDGLRSGTVEAAISRGLRRLGPAKLATVIGVLEELAGEIKKE